MDEAIREGSGLMEKDKENDDEDDDGPGRFFTRMAEMKMEGNDDDEERTEED